jgi:metal-responsive CopG/Arc/MetJ family transcriptional regulator
MRTQISLSLDENLLEEFERIMHAEHLRNRTACLEFLVNQYIKEEAKRDV